MKDRLPELRRIHEQLQSECLTEDALVDVTIAHVGAAANDAAANDADERDANNNSNNGADLDTFFRHVEEIQSLREKISSKGKFYD
jgi:hypothetical protein